MIADALSGFAARSTASIRAARDLAGRFWRAENGVALIEFAFTLPVMVILYLGSIVVTQGMMTDRKVTLLTRALGDIVAQDTTVTATERDEIFNAARVVMTPYDVGPEVIDMRAPADYSAFHHIRNSSYMRPKKPASATGFSATSGAEATSLPSSITRTVPMA